MPSSPSVSSKIPWLPTPYTSGWILHAFPTPTSLEFLNTDPPKLTSQKHQPLMYNPQTQTPVAVTANPCDDDYDGQRSGTRDPSSLPSPHAMRHPILSQCHATTNPSSPHCYTMPKPLCSSCDEASNPKLCSSHLAPSWMCKHHSNPGPCDGRAVILREPCSRGGNCIIACREWRIGGKSRRKQLVLSLSFSPPLSFTRFSSELSFLLESALSLSLFSLFRPPFIGGGLCPHLH